MRKLLTVVLVMIIAFGGTIMVLNPVSYAVENTVKVTQPIKLDKTTTKVNKINKLIKKEKSVIEKNKEVKKKTSNKKIKEKIDAANAKARQHCKYYQRKIQKLNRYKYATYIWNFFKSKGYSDAVCAGLLGNFMAEVGGQTLSLQPYLYDSGYYGFAQWSLYYTPNISGASIKKQCEYLAKTIKKEINIFGFKYYSGFNYKKFCKLKTPEAAAKAFAVCYERCASWAVACRIPNARTAYNYYCT